MQVYKEQVSQSVWGLELPLVSGILWTWEDTAIDEAVEMDSMASEAERMLQPTKIPIEANITGQLSASYLTDMIITEKSGYDPKWSQILGWKISFQPWSQICQFTETAHWLKTKTRALEEILKGLLTV